MIGGHGGNIFELARELGCRPEEILDMSSNVNPLGPPPGLLEHLARRLDAATRLPEVDNRGLLEAFSTLIGVRPERLVAGNGTTQFIYSIPAVLTVKSALIVGPTYSDYADACRLAGISPRFFLSSQARGFQPDLGRLSAEIRASGADTVFICNPNNPTGALVPADALKRLCREHPNVRFVVDESYLPFVPDGEAASLVRCGLERVIVLQSISKIFCIPGLRIGFLTAPREIAAAFARVLRPWSVNSLAQAAADFLAQAGGALEGFSAETRRFLTKERRRLQERLGGIAGLTVFPSAASFLLIRLPPQLKAGEVFRCFAKERVLIRDCSNFHGLSERYIRVSPKTADANRWFAERLAELAATGQPPRRLAGAATG
jgi:threonine-phosphate decarboxylase